MLLHRICGEYYEKGKENTSAEIRSKGVLSDMPVVQLQIENE